MSQPSRMSIPLVLVALMIGGHAPAQTPDADIEAVQRKLDAAKQAQAAKDAAAKREADQRAAAQAAERRQREQAAADAAASEARMATLLFRTDADCSLSINGEAQGVLAAGQTKAVKVNPGDQIVEVIRCEDCEAGKA